jgi:endoplasmic reticulum Man9GlcNAc2 1,2-alpha-mannosidase
MNVRDPFNLHRHGDTSPTPNLHTFGPGLAAAQQRRGPLFPGVGTPLDILRANATQAAVEFRDRAAEVGAQALHKGRQAVQQATQQAQQQAQQLVQQAQQVLQQQDGDIDGAYKKKDDDYDYNAEATGQEGSSSSGGEAAQSAEEAMAFAVPRNVPSFANPGQRAAEDHLWASASASSSRHRPAAAVLDDVQEKVGQFLNPNKNTLPMYKDKPYGYAPSQRRRPLYRQKRVLGFLLIFVLLVFWYMGALDRHHVNAKGKLTQWGWLKEDSKAKSKADWLKRRERVVEAFQLSWDEYERYAWGKLIWCLAARACALSWRCGDDVLTCLHQVMMCTTRYQRQGSKWLRKAWVGSSLTRLTP